MKDRIIGHFFCEPTVTGPVYLDMFEQFMYPQVAAIQPSIIYQQDGVPPCWSKGVRGSLNATFPNRWIGLEPIHSPPRSPDLTPLDFFLWGHVKDSLFTTPVNNIGELRTIIRNVIAIITDEKLTRTLQEFEYRLDIVRATNGAHVEVN